MNRLSLETFSTSILYSWSDYHGAPTTSFLPVSVGTVCKRNELVSPLNELYRELRLKNHTSIYITRTQIVGLWD